MNTNELAVGTAASINFWQDIVPAVVTKVSKSGKTAFIQRIENVSLHTGHTPAHYNGPWPVWDHTYTEEEVANLPRVGEETRISLRKDGQWKVSGSTATVTFGKARYRRDWSS